jgi:hypothetical protein
MKKMQYQLTIFFDLKHPEDPTFWDYQTEEYYFDTYTEAEKEAAKHHIGDIEGYYGDGVQCVVSDVIISDEPQEVEYFD